MSRILDSIPEGDEQFSKFYDDAIAYVKWAIKAKRMPAEIVNTMIHDIGGLVRRERCFVPRVSGYAKTEKKNAQKQADRS